MLPASTAVLYLAIGFGGGGSVRCSSWMRVSGFDGIGVCFAHGGWYTAPGDGPVIRAARRPVKQPPRKKTQAPDGCPRPAPGRSGNCAALLFLLAEFRLEVLLEGVHLRRRLPHRLLVF